MSARVDSALSCLEAGTHPRVYYIDNGNHVCELATNGVSWEFSQLPGAAAKSGSVITSDTITDLPHVYYIGVDDCIHELSKHEGQWVNTVVSDIHLPQIIRWPGWPGPYIPRQHGGKHLLVIFISADNQIIATEKSTGKWVKCVLPKTPLIRNNSPIAVEGLRVYYIDVNDKVNLLELVETAWVNTTLH